ncbi:MAG: right-handed parallel beta-helix repeat-containing protein, partial [Thermoplasmata archaeon]|nr:right-handed parallel beta-helix repeat-containing protein [Thermoplasmata archaeon]
MALCVVLSIALLAPSTEAADIIVDDDVGVWMDYDKIQDAIDNATTGDHIYVYEGTYDEQVVVTVGVTITGNGTGAIVQWSSVPSAGVYDVEIDASGTVIENMLFDFNGAGDGRGGTGFVVSDLNGPDVTDVIIRDNVIYTGDASGVGGTGIQTGKNADVGGLVVRGNVFYCDWDNMGEGVYVNPFNGTGNVTVYDNEFYGYIFSAISSESSEVNAVGNTIDSNTTQGVYGIRWFARPPCGNAYVNKSITDNEIQNCQHGIRVGTDGDWGSTLTITLSYNTLTNNDNGIWARYGTDITAMYNDIYDNADYGVYNEGTDVVDATYNYWGATDGPDGVGSGSGDNVTANVLYDPFYTQMIGNGTNSLVMSFNADETISGLTETIDTITVTNGATVTLSSCDLTLTGGITVTSGTLVMDDVTIRMGDDIVIAAGSSWTLGNSPNTIYAEDIEISGNVTWNASVVSMDCTSDLQYHIWILSGGELNVINGTTVTRNGSFNYEFQVQSGGVLWMKDSTVEFAGSSSGSGPGQYGLYVAGAATLEGSTVTDCYVGLVADAAGISIETTDISGNALQALHVAGADDVSAEYNYWGSVLETDILDAVHDSRDNASRGTVDYSPWYDQTFTTLYWSDIWAPTTTLTVGTPKVGTGPYWVTEATILNMTATDGNGTGVADIWYRVWYGGSWSAWASYTTEFTLTGECLHHLEFNAEDNIGNNETAQNVTLYVDLTEPTTVKTVGSPSYSGGMWVTSATTFNLSATDAGCNGGVGLDEVLYRTWYGSWSSWLTYATEFTLTGEGMHHIEFYAVDLLGNAEVTQNQTHYVDDTAPTTTKTVSTPKYGALDLWVNESTMFTLNANDGSSGVAAIYYRIYYNGSWTAWTTYTGAFNLSGECVHYLEWFAMDNVWNNESVHNQTHRVDISGPWSFEYVGYPLYRNGEWVTTGTEFNLTATDFGCMGGVGVGGIMYRLFYNSTWTAWANYTGNFSLTDEGMWVLEWYSIDLLGNIDWVFDYNNQTHFVDDTAPTTTIDIGTPQYGNGTTLWVNDTTVFGFTVDDGTGVGLNATWYRIWYGGAWSGWLNHTALGDFTLTAGEGMYHIEYYSTDLMRNNETVQNQTCVVEDTGPTTTLMVGPPSHGTSPTYVTSTTTFTLSATDAASGVQYTEYFVDSLPWMTYGSPFNVSAAGAHTIYYRSVDNVNNTEANQTIDIFVDDTAPTTTLTVGSPRYGANDTYVTSSSPFSLSGSDGSGSGVAAIDYRIYDGSSWGAWTTYTVPFTLPAVDGTYFIEFNATDNLGNVEATQNHTQMVDDTPPASTLTVGSPQHIPFVTEATPINLTATDGGVGLDSIMYRIWNGSWSTWTSYTVEFTLTWEGIHHVEVHAVDLLGNVEADDNRTLFVDVTAPVTSVTLSGPSHLDHITSMTEVNLTSIDGAGSGVGAIDRRIWNGTAWSDWTAYSGNFTLPAIDGTYYLEFYATDELGNVETANNRTLIVDDTAPVSTLVVGMPRYMTFVSEATQFNLTALDGGAGIDAIEYRVWNGTEWTAWTAYSAEFTLPTMAGNHTIEYMATDMLGNAETPGSLEVIVDPDAPSIVIVSPAGESLQSGVLEIDANVMDATLNASDVWYWWDADAPAALPF